MSGDILPCRSGHLSSDDDRESGSDNHYAGALVSSVNNRFTSIQPLSHALTIGGPGDIRVGPILAIPDILAEFGTNPQRAFSQADVDPQLFLDPDNRIQIERLGHLFEVCAALTDCPHFGLLVGDRFNFPTLGPLGYLMRNSPTVGDALRSLLLHLHLHDRGAAPVLLSSGNSSVTLGYSVYRHGTPGVGHILDATMAITYRILVELCGPTWVPQYVQLSHNKPAELGPYRRIFHANLTFGAEVSGLTFATTWLTQPIEGADPRLHALIATAIQKAEATGPMSFSELVEGVLPQLILNGTASSEVIARLFAVHERTLRRRLRADGKGLQQIINRARFELAQQLLENTALPVSAIATALHYDDPNAFSRAFRSWAQLSPVQWRARFVG